MLTPEDRSRMFLGAGADYQKSTERVQGKLNNYRLEMERLIEARIDIEQQLEALRRGERAERKRKGSPLSGFLRRLGLGSAHRTAEGSAHRTNHEGRIYNDDECPWC